MSTLGRNIAFPIYKGNGSSFHNLVIRKSTSDSVVMSLGDKVTGDVYYKDNTLVCDMDEYIMVDGVKYSIVNPPTIVREGLKSDNGDLKGMTKYSFEFYHPMYMLGNMAFSDVAVTNAESMFKSHDRTFSWIGNLTDFVAKLNKNLQDSQFIVSISSSIDADSRKVLSDVLSFTNNTIADALKTAYDTWHFPFVVDAIKSGEQYYSQGKRFLIQFGNPTREILDANNQPFVFHFGKGVGLKNNSRTPRNNKIVTRVAGYGSEQNIPYGYPQIPWTGDPSATTTADGYPIYEGIVGGVVTKLVKHPFTRTHLMPSVYAESVRKKVNSAAPDYDNTTPLIDYYDAPSSYPNPINLNAPKLDIVGFDDIKPELGDMAIVGAVPVNDDLTPASGWDDTMDDDGNYLQSYFKITLPQLDFDIYACASITEEMKINMRSGACIGCTFDAQVDWDDYKKNFFDAQGNFLPNGEQRDLSKYPKSNNGSIDLIVKKDLNTYGMLMPNVYQQPAQGDKFVILGISMPSTYITNAEERLDAALMTHMLDNNVYYYDYPLKFDEDFFYNNTDILSQVRPNSVLRFTFGGEEKSLYIKQITIKYGEGVLPKYDITLTDNIEVVLNQIGLVADDVSRLALAMMQMNKRTNINISNTESLQKYVDYTIMPNLESIQRQIDGSQVTYFGNEDPFDSAHPYSDGKYVVDPTKFPASEWDDDYSEHDGDMFYNRETGKGYEFTIIDNSASPVVYGWQLIQDEDIIQALNNAQTAQDTADGKRRVFICDASHHTPNPPYDVGDLWVNVKYPYSTGATYDDEILKCVVAKTEGQSFSINDWSLANGYTAALRNFINGTYADDLEDIQNQIDGKAETWYQNTDPSTAWTTPELKAQHKGDIWHNSSNATINGVKAGQDAIWNGTAWVVDETVPAAIYDEIDGKCAIYVSWGAWGNDLQEKDLFIPSANVTPTGSSVTYYANKVYRCVDKDTPTFQEIAYTDDTQYNGFITKLIGSSGQTKDAAENAIAAIKHALNEGNTYNEGGLILSNLISLGTGNPTSGTFTPWAGISGIYKTSETGTGYKGHGIAAWFGGGMVDGEVSQSATNAAKSLFRFDGSGYVAGGNLSWDKNGNVTIQGYSINATTLQVGGSNVATESSISTFFANFFDIYNGSTQITYAQYVALQDKSNVSIKAKYGLWTEQFLSALGMNSQGGGTGGGGVSSIRVSSSSVITPDTDGIVDLTNYVSTANERNAWNNASSMAHTHSNKSVLDGITSAKVTSWDAVAAIMGEDPDEIINKWNEIIAFLLNIPEQTTLEQLLAAKANSTVQIIAGNGLTGGGNLQENRTLNVASANAAITVNADNIQLNVINDYTTTTNNTIIPLAAARGKDLNDRLAVLESWFEVDSNGDIKTKDKPNGTHRGFYSESFVSALGSNSSGGGAGGGTVTGIIIGSGNPILPDSNGSVTIPAYPTSVTWANVTGKPSWIGSSKPTYAIGEIQNSALSGNGFLKKTGTNTWGIDTNTYALTSDVYSSSASRTANTVLAAPNGSAGAATFRALVAADIPSLAISKITNLQTTLDAKALKTTTISAGNGLTGGGDLSSNRELAIQLQSNSGLSVSSSGLKLDIINNLTTESAYKAISATQAKKIWDLLNQMFTLEGAGTSASPYVIKANYGLYTEQFLSALGQNTSGGGTGGGTVTGIKLVSGNAIQPDTDGIVTLPSATSSVYGVVKLGTSSTTAATGNHTHALSIAADSGTNQLSLTANTKYKLTAGGSTFIFTTPSDTTYSAGTGLSLSGTTINHSNSVTAQTTQAVYPIKIDAQGHISAYGSAVSLGTASSHAHTDYVTSISWNSTNNNLAWSKGGTAQTAITIGYATSAGTASKVGSSTLGSATKPIYLSSGTATECSTYAGGTAVTLNGTSKAASTASFYAPTASGTANQVMISGGANTAPSWTAQSNLSVGSLTTVSKTAWGQTYWTSGGVPATISGDLSSVGNIYMSNNKHIYAKKYNDTDTNVSLLYLSTGNTLVLGSGTVAVSSNTLVYGGTSFCVRIGGTGSDTYNALLIDTSKNTTLNGALSVKSGITLTTTKKIYFGDTDHYLELNSTGFHFSHGVYSDSFVSALGANSSGGGGGGGTVTGIKLASNTSAINPDANGIVTIPAATTSAFGVVKVGSTLSVSSGTLNLKASGVTANTYRSVTVDTYGRVTAGTNPTTLAGYGILDDTDGRYYALYGGTSINSYGTSSSHYDLNKLTTVGSYYCSGNTTSAYFDNMPSSVNHAFRIWVSAPTGTDSTYRRQRFQYYDYVAAYERISDDSGSTWSAWYTIQASLANYALASSLDNYLPLTGGTLTGTLRVENITTSSSAGLLTYHPSDWTAVSNTQWGVGTVDSQGVIRSSNANLIHYKGGTNYTICDGSNTYVSSGKGYINGTEITTATKDGSGNTITSTYLTAIGRSGDYLTQTKGGTTSNVTKIFERRSTYSHSINTAGWYRVGEFSAKAAGGATCIMMINKNFSTSGNVGYVFAITLSYNGNISITQIAGDFYSSSLIDKIRVEYVTGNGDFNPPIDIHISSDTSTSNTYYVTIIGSANALSEYTKDPTLTGSTFEFTTTIGTKTATPSTHSTLVSASNTNGTVGICASTNRGLIDVTNNAWIVGTNGTNTWLSQGNVGIGTDSPSYKLDVSGTLGVTGKSTMSGCLNITGSSDGYDQGIRIHDVGSTSSVWFRCANASGNDAGMIGITGNTTGLLFRLPSTSTGTSYTSYLTIAYGGAATFAGTIEARTNAYNYTGDTTSYGLNMHNSDIVNVNGIFGSDTQDNWTEGINFKRTNSNWDSLRVKDGLFYFSSNNSSSAAGTESVQILPSAAGSDIGLKLIGSSYAMSFIIGSGNTNRGIYDHTNSKWAIYFNASNTILNFGNVGIGNTSPSQKLHVTGNILASGDVTASSDERKKNIISNTKFNVKDIASARSIIYEWNDDRDKDNEKKIHGGSIAQDWLGKADSFLSQDNDGWYSINYGALALCSAITIARMTINHEDRITLLEKENARLKARVAELEERRIA